VWFDGLGVTMRMIRGCDSVHQRTTASSEDRVEIFWCKILGFSFFLGGGKASEGKAKGKGRTDLGLSLRQLNRNWGLNWNYTDRH
jgi:hypothetical protein